jgi:hypothetical protein
MKWNERKDKRFKSTPKGENPLWKMWGNVYNQSDELTQDEIEEPLPPWASSHNEGDYTHIGASLATRDGRNHGNAFVDMRINETIDVGGFEGFREIVVYLVKTEAGNSMRLTLNEMQRMFYPPKWNTKIDIARARWDAVRELR